MTKDDIGTKVQQFIRTNFLFDADRQVEETHSLLGTGVVDSTGVLELISFLETTFGVKFNDEELVAENFDSVERIKEFIFRKLHKSNGSSDGTH